MQQDPDRQETPSRPVIGVGNDYPPSFELARHAHRRGQLLHATSGAMAVSTPAGAWVCPPERAIWIPAGTPHSVRMIGAVSTRSVMVAPEIAAAMHDQCRVLAVSALLSALLAEAASLPDTYDEAGRDGLVMRLVIAEIARAPVVPLAVPFPRRPALARRCHEFFEHPDIKSGIDDWAAGLKINRRAFTRLFRAETGMSFAQWREQACLASALPRLAAGHAITEIALDLGYDSPASFSTMFRRVLGQPPSRHR